VRIAQFELDRGTPGTVPDAGFYFKSAVGKKDLRKADLARRTYLTATR
jgi:hypothetical protein